MEPETSNHELFSAWKNGDQQAASLLFRRYQARLMALIRSRLSRKLARRLDPEDIVLSAYRSFFVAARNGRNVVPDDDDLWPLLTTIALRKLARQARRNAADGRSVDREQSDLTDWVKYIGSHEPDAEHAAILADEVDRLLGRLDDTAREVLVRTLQGEDAVSIAKALNLHERTVRRALERIREELSGDPAVSLPSVSARTIPLARHRPAQGTVTYNQYLLKQFLGAGAFSKVYRAIDKATNEVVAIKFLRKECWDDERATASLIAEYQILKRLNHPNILAIHGWGTTPRGALFLVTDFVPGMNLSEWRSKQPPTAGRIAEIVCQVAEAIAAAHAAGVLHCDLKPSNVMLRDDGQVVLCDFGLARYATDPEDVPRGGTAGFLCPEQISDAFGPITKRSDVYGLGALVYALLTGQPPVTGRDLPETVANVLSARIPLAPSQAGASTPELDAVVLHCLQKESGRRPTSATEVASALKNRH